MSDTPDIEPLEGVGVGEAAAVAAAVAAAAVCISCGTQIVGAFCAGCGQKNDDMRRSSFVLFKDFLVDTFSFDGRMWRTLGLLAATPGKVPSDYSHGKRSRYTPPVRLFLVVSFLFFLILSLTHTLIVAIDVRARTPEEQDRVEATIGMRIKMSEEEIEKATERARAASGGQALVIDGRELDCKITATTRYFVRADDIAVDRDLWARCRDSLLEGIRSEIESGAEADPVRRDEAVQSLTLVERVAGGVSKAIEDPVAFNAGLNNWLPRVMFVMAPVLALILTLFLRRGALIFDHLVFALYAHAVAFAIIGLAVIAAQLRLPHVFTAASIALGLYFIVAIKRGYGRGWIKSLWTGAGAGFLYFIVLSIAVVSILSDQVLRGA